MLTREDAVMQALVRLVTQTEPNGAEADPRELAAAVQAVSQAYTRERHAIDQNATGEAAYRARRHFYLPRDGAKVVKPLWELHLAGALPQSPRLRVLDLGAGLGSTSLGAAATFAGLPRNTVRELAVDAVERDPGALRHFTRIAAGAEAVGLPRVRVRPLAVDLRKHEPDGPYDLILAGLVLNELLAEPPEQAAQRLVGLVSQLAPHGSLIVLEPALREPTRALHATRDALRAHGSVALFGPCVHHAACPMLTTAKDWCHEDVDAALPEALGKVAREAGLRFERLTYAYLTLRRREDAASVAGLLPTDPHPDLGAHRVVSQVLASKGKREWFACGQRGRVRVTRLDRHASAVNAGFGAAQRGDVVRLPVLGDGSSDVRVKADTELTGWFYGASEP